MSLQKLVNGIVGIPLALLAAVVCLGVFTFASSGVSKSEAGPYAVGFANATGKEAAAALTFQEQMGRAFGKGFGETWAISHPSVPEGEQTAATVQEQAAAVIAAAPTSAPVIVPTQAPPVRSSDESERALTAWMRGDLTETRRLYGAALRNNPQDKLAAWLADFDEKNCRADYEAMTSTKPDSRTAVQKILDSAGRVAAFCNPQLREAYVVGRMAKILLSVDEQGNLADANLLKGLEIAVVSKDGPPRRIREGDAVTVNIATFGDEGFDGFPQLKVTAGALNGLLSDGAWEVGKTYEIPGGSLVPENLPEPTQPTEANLAVPTPAPAPTTAPTAQPPAGETGGGGGKTYSVQSGEWAMKIARDHETDLAGLQAANPGVDLNSLQPGQVLNLP